MTYEHEIIFNDDSQELHLERNIFRLFLTSTTIYLNKEDLEYLTELEIELHSIKRITSYKK